MSQQPSNSKAVDHYYAVENNNENPESSSNDITTTQTNHGHHDVYNGKGNRNEASIGANLVSNNNYNTQNSHGKNEDGNFDSAFSGHEHNHSHNSAIVTTSTNNNSTQNIVSNIQSSDNPTIVNSSASVLSNTTTTNSLGVSSKEHEHMLSNHSVGNLGLNKNSQENAPPYQEYHNHQLNVTFQSQPYSMSSSSFPNTFVNKYTLANEGSMKSTSTKENEKLPLPSVSSSYSLSFSPPIKSPTHLHEGMKSYPSSSPFYSKTDTSSPLALTSIAAYKPILAYPTNFLNEDRHMKGVFEDCSFTNNIPNTWRVKERMKTVAVGLCLCLNLGTDPPDVVRKCTHPAARRLCWIDPTSMSKDKATDAIGNALQEQYERLQPRAKYKQSLDPTMEDVKKMCLNLRRHAKEDRILFHYNGHGVPRPTSGGEIWVFNKSYTQYIPLSVYDLRNWIESPTIYVLDCSNAGILLPHFLQPIIMQNQSGLWANQMSNSLANGNLSSHGTNVNEELNNNRSKDNKHNNNNNGIRGDETTDHIHHRQQNDGIGNPRNVNDNEKRSKVLFQNSLNDSKNPVNTINGMVPDMHMQMIESIAKETIVLGPCGPGETLPQSPGLPADLFTACLTSPIHVALRWFIIQNPLPMGNLDPDFVKHIPGKLSDRRMPLGELNWVFTAITDTIAWNTLPSPLFQKLFRQDLLVASLFRNFLLAERILRACGCTPFSIPRLPSTSLNPLWQSWDLAAEACLSQLISDQFPTPLTADVRAGLVSSVMNMNQYHGYNSHANTKENYSRQFQVYNQINNFTSSLYKEMKRYNKPLSDYYIGGGHTTGTIINGGERSKNGDKSLANFGDTKSKFDSVSVHSNANSVMAEILDKKSKYYCSVPFFAEQLTAFEVWLNFHSNHFQPQKLNSSEDYDMQKKGRATNSNKNYKGNGSSAQKTKKKGTGNGNEHDIKQGGYEEGIYDTDKLHRSDSNDSTGNTGSSQLNHKKSNYFMEKGTHRQSGDESITKTAEHSHNNPNTRIATDVNRPEQLPVVLQVLLSQAHRLRALMLLARFVEIGPWAVNLALFVGIFPYVLRLLQSPALDLRQILICIWSRILASDTFCRIELVKDNSFSHFITHLADKDLSDEQRILAAHILCIIMENYREGQAKSLNFDLHLVVKNLLLAAERGVHFHNPTNKPSKQEVTAGISKKVHYSNQSSSSIAQLYKGDNKAWGNQRFPSPTKEDIELYLSSISPSTGLLKRWLCFTLAQLCQGYPGGREAVCAPLKIEDHSNISHFEESGIPVPLAPHYQNIEGRDNSATTLESGTNTQSIPSMNLPNIRKNTGDNNNREDNEASKNQKIFERTITIWKVVAKLLNDCNVEVRAAASYALGTFMGTYDPVKAANNEDSSDRHLQYPPSPFNLLDLYFSFGSNMPMQVGGMSGIKSHPSFGMSPSTSSFPKQPSNLESAHMSSYTQSQISNPPHSTLNEYGSPNNANNSNLMSINSNLSLIGIETITGTPSMTQLHEQMQQGEQNSKGSNNIRYNQSRPGENTVNTGSIYSSASIKDLHKLPLDQGFMNMNLKSSNMIQTLNNFNTFANSITTNTYGNQNNVASHPHPNVSLKYQSSDGQGHLPNIPIPPTLRSTSTPDLSSSDRKDVPNRYKGSQTSNQYHRMDNNNDHSYAPRDTTDTDINRSILQDINVSGSFLVSQTLHQMMYHSEDQEANSSSTDNILLGSGPKIKTKLPTNINKGSGLGVSSAPVRGNVPKGMFDSLHNEEFEKRRSLDLQIGLTLCNAFDDPSPLVRRETLYSLINLILDPLHLPTFVHVAMELIKLSREHLQSGHLPRTPLDPALIPHPYLNALQMECACGNVPTGIFGLGTPSAWGSLVNPVGSLGSGPYGSKSYIPNISSYPVGGVYGPNSQGGTVFGGSNFYMGGMGVGSEGLYGTNHSNSSNLFSGSYGAEGGSTGSLPGFGIKNSSVTNTHSQPNINTFQTQTHHGGNVTSKSGAKDYSSVSGYTSVDIASLPQINSMNLKPIQSNLSLTDLVFSSEHGVGTFPGQLYTSRANSEQTDRGQPHGMTAVGSKEKSIKFGEKNNDGNSRIVEGTQQENQVHSNTSTIANQNNRFISNPSIGIPSYLTNNSNANLSHVNFNLNSTNKVPISLLPQTTATSNISQTSLPPSGGLGTTSYGGNNLSSKPGMYLNNTNLSSHMTTSQSNFLSGGAGAQSLGTRYGTSFGSNGTGTSGRGGRSKWYDVLALRIQQHIGNKEISEMYLHIWLSVRQVQHKEPFPYIHDLAVQLVAMIHEITLELDRSNQIFQENNQILKQYHAMINDVLAKHITATALYASKLHLSNIEDIENEGSNEFDDKNNIESNIDRGSFESLKSVSSIASGPFSSNMTDVSHMSVPDNLGKKGNEKEEKQQVKKQLKSSHSSKADTSNLQDAGFHKTDSTVDDNKMNVPEKEKDEEGDSEGGERGRTEKTQEMKKEITIEDIVNRAMDLINGYGESGYRVSQTQTTGNTANMSLSGEGSTSRFMNNDTGTYSSDIQIELAQLYLQQEQLLHLRDIQQLQIQQAHMMLVQQQQQKHIAKQQALIAKYNEEQSQYKAKHKAHQENELSRQSRPDEEHEFLSEQSQKEIKSKEEADKAEVEEKQREVGNNNVTGTKEDLYKNTEDMSKGYLDLENQNEGSGKDVSGEMLMGLNAQNLVRHLSDKNIEREENDPSGSIHNSHVPLSLPSNPEGDCNTPPLPPPSEIQPLKVIPPPPPPALPNLAEIPLPEQKFVPNPFTGYMERETYKKLMSMYRQSNIYMWSKQGINKVSNHTYHIHNPPYPYYKGITSLVSNSFGNDTQKTVGEVSSFPTNIIPTSQKHRNGNCTLGNNFQSCNNFMISGIDVESIIQRAYESEDKEDSYGAQIDPLSAQGQAYLYRKKRNLNILNEATDLAEKMTEAFGSLTSERDDIKSTHSYFNARSNPVSKVSDIPPNLVNSIASGIPNGTSTVDSGLGGDRNSHPMSSKGNIDGLSKSSATSNDAYSNSKGKRVTGDSQSHAGNTERVGSRGHIGQHPASLSYSHTYNHHYPKSMKMEQKTILKNEAEMTSLLAFHPFEPLLVSTDDTSRISIWQYEEGRKLLSYHNGNKSSSRLTSMTWLNESEQSLLLTASDDGIMRVWKGILESPTQTPYLASASCLHSLAGRKGSGLITHYMAKYGRLISGGSSDRVRIWDLNSEQLIREWTTNSTSCITTITSSSLHTVLPTDGRDGTDGGRSHSSKDVYDTNNQANNSEHRNISNGRNGNMHYSYFSNASNLSNHQHASFGSAFGTESVQSSSFFGGGNHYQSLYNNFQEKQEELYTSRSHEVGNMSNNLGPSVVVTGFGDGTVKLWDTRLDSAFCTLSVDQQKNSWVVCTDVVKNDRELVTGTLAGEIKMWDWRNLSAPIRSMEGGKGYMTALTSHQYCPIMASGSYEQFIKVMTVDGEPYDVIRYHEGILGQRIGPVATLAFHPFKMILAAGAADSIISLYSSNFR